MMENLKSKTDFKFSRVLHVRLMKIIDLRGALLVEKSHLARIQKDDNKKE